MADEGKEGATGTVRTAKVKTVDICLRSAVYIDKESDKGDIDFKTMDIKTYAYFEVPRDIALVDFREEVLFECKDKKLVVDDITGKLYRAQASNSQLMVEISSSIQLQKKWPTKGGTFYVGIGAQHDDYSATAVRLTELDAAGYLIGLRDPPTGVTKQKENTRNASHTDNNTRTLIRVWAESIYTDGRSDFHHGFTVMHRGIMSTHLADLSTTNEKLFKELLIDVARGEFPALADADKYATGDGGWAATMHMSSAQGCVIGRDKYPPMPNGEMPTADQGRKMDVARRRGGAGTGEAPAVTPVNSAANALQASARAQEQLTLVKLQQEHAKSLATQVAAAPGPAGESKLEKYKRKFDTALGQKEQLQKVGTKDNDPLMLGVNAEVSKYKKAFDRENSKDDSFERENSDADCR
jgi:hypothetical protein